MAYFIDSLTIKLMGEGETGMQIRGNTQIIEGTLTNAEVNASAAIAYSKLNLTNEIVNADIDDAAAIAQSKLSLAITNSEVDAAAGIVYSKLSIADADLTIAKTSGLQTALDAKLALAGGTMSGAIAMGTNKITGMGDPVAAQDAATKAYVDTQDATADTFVELTDTPANYTGAANKVVSVNAGGTALEFTTAGSATLLGLSDTPGAYTGLGGKFLKVNGAADAVEFVVGGIVNADVASAAGIIYSKLTIADADLTIAKTSGLQTALDAKLALAGGTMSGAIAMGTNKITGLGDPSAAQDAATKTYVDSAAYVPVQETATTVWNGTLTDYTLSAAPASVASVKVYLNGLIQEQGAGKDYTLSGSVISFVVAPKASDVAIVCFAT